MSGVSRRTLLKGGVVGLSSVVLGPDFFLQCFGVDDPQRNTYVSLYTGRVVQGIPTTCGLCPAGCGMLAFVDEGSLVGLAGNPEHPYNRGALCAFGSAASSLLNGPCRIRKPLRRLGKRGERRWEEVPWEKALRAVTSALSDLKGEASRHGLAICVPGWEATPMVDRFLAFFQNSLLAVEGEHEHWVETAALQSFCKNGVGAPDLAGADRVLNFGANPLGSIRRLVGSARQWAEGKDKGVTWITLDPRLSETAAASHTWIPLRPGTDGPFALAVAHQIVKNQWEDRSFLQGATDVDPGTLWEILAPWTPEKAGALCEISADRIRWTAEAFTRADRPVAIFGSGVTARKGGLETARAILLLNLLVGNIGQKGGFRRTGRPGWKQPDPFPLGNDEVPVLGGTLFWDLRRATRQIGCLLSHDANPAVTDPDAGETARTLRDESRVPFHVALASYWNETNELADLVLPASTFIESWGLVASSGVADPFPWISLRQPVCRSVGDALSLDELLLVIAGRLGEKGKRAFPFENVEAYYRRLLEASHSPEKGRDSFEEARTRGFVSAVTAAEVREEKMQLKELLGRSVLAITKRTGDMGRDRLGSGDRTLILYASPTRGGRGYPCEWVEEIDHAEPLWIHPKTAQEIGCEDGDRVMLRGPAGSMETRARLTEGIHPEAAAMSGTAGDRGSQGWCLGTEGPQGGVEEQGCWWEPEAYSGNARKIIPWPEDPRRESPGWMDTTVTVSRLEKKAKG